MDVGGFREVCAKLKAQRVALTFIAATLEVRGVISDRTPLERAQALHTLGVQPSQSLSGRAGHAHCSTSLCPRVLICEMEKIKPILCTAGSK